MTPISILSLAVLWVMVLTKPAAAESTPVPPSPTGFQIRLPHVFASHMVLQQQKPIPIWGWAQPGEAITVELAGNKREARANDQGEWHVTLPAMKADGTRWVLTVSGANTLKLDDILIGEVWLCSGQSNMHWGIGLCLNAQNEIASANYPNIRLFLVPERGENVPQKDVNAIWKVCSPQTVAEGGWEGFSGVAYFFGRELHKSLNVPIGIVECCLGGSPIEQWAPPDGWGAIKELENTKPASTLFNGMIAPLAPFALRGAIWYQGEANMHDGDLYYHKMRALIGGWRHAWRHPPSVPGFEVPGDDFPFYFTQLTSFANGGDFAATSPEGNFGWPWPTLRESQVKAMRIPHTGMAVTMDIGRADKDQHAMNKQDVGRRLALWALAKDYEQKVACSGPVYHEHQVKGNEVIIAFDYADEGLMVGVKNGLDPVKELPEGKLKWVAIAGADKKFCWADARIEGMTLVVSSTQVPNPVAVRYAFTMYTDGAMLYNKAGLPASQFRTDDWLVKNAVVP